MFYMYIIYIYHKVLCIAPQKLGVKCLKTLPQSLCKIRTKNEEIFNHDFWKVTYVHAFIIDNVIKALKSNNVCKI